jgi:alanine racemase
MTHPAWLEISTSKFLQNIAAVRQRTGTKICLPVKANAYGHGLVAIGKIAEPLVDYLGVSCCQEGVLLRKSGISCPIIVFGAIHYTQIEELLTFDLEISISSRLKAEWIGEYCRKQQRKCRIHVEIDTGMQRTGMRPETALSLLGSLEKDPSFEIVGIYSHLATSETPNDPFALRQIELFS